MNHSDKIRDCVTQILRQEKFRLLPVLLLIFALALGGGVGRWRQGRELPGTQIASEIADTETEVSSAIPTETANLVTATTSAEETTVDNLTVYVCGAVQFPGVYTLQRDRRVIDAIEAAGGFLEEADEEYWNLAESLSDGEQIRIPTREESASLEPRQNTGGQNGMSTGSGAAGAASDGLVNLNTAEATELMTLPGIGESKALAIIAYREEHGPFQSIEDVMQVSGIKQNSFDKIKDKIKI